MEPPIIISGGQSGADLAGLNVARYFNFPLEGYAAKGWLQCDINNPARVIAAEWLGEFLKECPEEGFPARTRMNVEICDGIALFGNPQSHGSIAALNFAAPLCKPVIAINKFGHDTKAVEKIQRQGYQIGTTPRSLVEFMEGQNHAGKPIRRLMIAGNRENSRGAFGKWVFNCLCRTFRSIGYIPPERVDENETEEKDDTD